MFYVFFQNQPLMFDKLMDTYTGQAQKSIQLLAGNGLSSAVPWTSTKRS